MLVAMASTVTFAVAKDSPATKPEFTIAITAPQTTVKLGSPIVLNLTEANISEHDLPRTSTSQGTRFMDIKLYDTDGKAVPETEHGKLLHGRSVKWPNSHSGFIQRFIPKGQSFHEESDLSKEFILDKPGTYTVQAEHFDYASQVLVKSNAITLTLTN